MKVLAAVLVLAGVTLAAAPASADRYNCRNCAPLKKYDSQKVVRTSKTVDHSRVINTYSVVYKKVIRRAPAAPRQVAVLYPSVVKVNWVTQKYRVTHGPHPDSMIRVVYPVAPRCKYGVSRHGSCVLRVRG